MFTTITHLNPVYLALKLTEAVSTTKKDKQYISFAVYKGDNIGPTYHSEIPTVKPTPVKVKNAN